MAFILGKDEDDKNKQGGGASGGAFAGSLAPQAVQGTGGQQNWVNIQEYLNANPNGSRGQELLQQEFNPSLTQDESRLQNDANAYNERLGVAEGAPSQLNDLTNTLSGLKQRYFDARTGIGGQQENQAASRMISVDEGRLGSVSQNPLGEPSIFGFSQSQQTNQIPGALKDSNQFRNTINTLYDKAYGYQGFNTGQAALQEQLDASNPAVAQKRNELLDRQSKLQDSANAKKSAFDTRRSNLITNANQSRDGLINNYNKYVNDKADFNNALSDKRYSDEGVQANPNQQSYSLKELLNMYNQGGQQESPYIQARKQNYNNLYNTLGNAWVSGNLNSVLRR